MPTALMSVQEGQRSGTPQTWAERDRGRLHHRPSTTGCVPCCSLLEQSGCRKAQAHCSRQQSVSGGPARSADAPLTECAKVGILFSLLPGRWVLHQHLQAGAHGAMGLWFSSPECDKWPRSALRQQGQSVRVHAVAGVGTRRLKLPTACEQSARSRNGAGLGMHSDAAGAEVHPAATPAESWLPALPA